MTLIRWNPSPITRFRDLTNIQDDFHRLFDDFFTRGSLRGDLSTVFTPAVDIDETAEEFVVRVDMPGVAQNDFKVSLMGDTLTIRGERRQEGQTREGTHHRLERAFGAFERSFTLATPVRGDKVKAQYRDGVLEVRVPKAEEARLKEIDVQVG